MAFVIADRVRETSTTTGAGNFTLAGAVTGYQTFDAALDTGDTTYYAIADQGGANWEVGIGTFTSPSTLARTTILSSSNGGSVVTFGAGTKDVFISLPSSKTNVEDQPNLIEVNSSSAALRITQTGAGNALVVEDSANPDATPFVVNASGNVGIGTSSPGEKLNVNSGAAEYAIQWSSTGSDDWVLASATNRAYITNKTTSVETFTILDGGNVGIGTSSPAQLLDVNGTIRTRANGAEGGQIEFNNPDNASVGAVLDVSTADVTRWFTVRNNTTHQIGQLAGTGGTIALYTAAAERMRIDASGNVGIGTSSPGSLLTVNGNLAFNSGYGSAAVAYGCRAWVNFNGTGTVAIRASGNVTSITDNGTGQYTMNFTTALPDANYCAAAASFVAGTAIIVRTISFATTSLSLNTTNSAASDVDASTVSIAIFR